MRLDDLDPSSNVDDLGNQGGGGFGGGGGGGLGGLIGLLPLLFGRKLGCGGIALIAIVAVVFLMMQDGGGGLMPGAVQDGAAGGDSAVSSTAGQSGAAVCNTPERLFSCRVLKSTEQTWGQIFQQQGEQYRVPRLEFYTGGAQSGCGFSTSAVGPYYCPADEKLYLDTSFFDELANRFGAKGDFAQAYVIAHEVGHHIQKLTGIAQQVSAQQARVGKVEGNHLSVRMELQADCYAGVWAAHNRDRLEPGDVEEGMGAAQAVGDDTLQKQMQGRVMPDAFTHGTAEQRMKWLRKGLDSGDPAACDTFSGDI